MTFHSLGGIKGGGRKQLYVGELVLSWREAIAVVAD